MKYTSLPFMIAAPAGYLILCALASACLSYPLHFILPQSLDYQALVFKTAEILMIAGLYPLGRWLGMGSGDLGLAVTKPQFLRQCFKGLGYGALMLGLHVTLLWLLDVRKLDPDKLYIGTILSLSIKGVLIGFLVAFIEEPVFRGFLLGAFIPKTGRTNAVLISAAYFAGLHFLNTELRPEFSEVRWDTSFLMIADAFHQLAQLSIDSFLALFTAGIFLACVRLLTPHSNLGLSIGIHAGWVFIIKTSSPILGQYDFYSHWILLIGFFNGIIGYLSVAWTVPLILYLAFKIYQSDQKLRLADSSYLEVAKFVVLAFTLIQFAFAGQTELIPEEAYYWTYSQHPALSYFDHPPMVAWVVWLGTALFGDNEIGVRAFALLAWPVSAWLLFQTGKLWFGVESAVRAVFLFCLTPIFVAVGFIVTPDAPLLFFWLLTLYAISQVMHTGQSRYWLLAGLGLGCAMLSKYTAVTLAGSLFLFLILSTQYRYWLLRIEPWLALVLGFLVFSPVIIWNAQHQWASFLFQSSRGMAVGHNPVTEASQFWFYQLMAVTPILFVFYAYILVPVFKRGWIQREDRWNFTASFALPLFTIFFIASFKNKGHINWTAPAYLSWLLAAAAFYPEIKSRLLNYRPQLLRWLIGFSAAISVAGISFGHLNLAWGIPKSLAFSNAGAWYWLALNIGKARDELSVETGKPAFIIGTDKLNISAPTGFYLHDTENTLNDYALGFPGIGYRYWVDLKKFEGRPAIVVIPKLNEFPLDLLKAFFTQVGEPVSLTVNGKGNQTRTVHVVKCYGYNPHLELR